MRHRAFVSVAVVLACSALAGCRAQTIESAAQALKGVYRVESYTVNGEGCDREGPSKLDQPRDRFFIVFGSKVMGRPVLSVLSCRDLAQCREKAAKQEQGAILSGDFGYTFTTLDPAGRLSAGYSSTGFASADKKSCSGGSAADRTLVRAEGKLRIEERARTAKDYPADAEGMCSTDRALAAAQGQPCRQLTVVTAIAQ